MNILFDFNKGDRGTSWEAKDVERRSAWVEGPTSTESGVKGGRSGEGWDGPGDVAPEAGISRMDSMGESRVGKENVKSRETSLKASKIVAVSEASSSAARGFSSFACPLSFEFGEASGTLVKGSQNKNNQTQ